METKISRKLGKEHLDSNGHVNNLEFERLYVDGQMNHIGAYGLSLESVEKQYGVRQFMRARNTEYLRPLENDREVIVRTNLSLGNTSLKYRQSIEGDNREIYSTSEQTIVMVDSSGRPSQISPELRRILESS